jgi:hypothetical protein
MTYETLVKIIIETIKRLDAFSRLRVGAFAIEAKNGQEVKTVAESLNGKCVFLRCDDLDVLMPCDILFMDRLPVERVPNLALGVSRDALDRYLNGVILNGGAILVLKNGMDEDIKARPAFRALMVSYARMLTSYGYVFLGRPEMGKKPEADTSTSPSHSRRVFTRKFLSRGDLLEYASDGSIALGNEVRMTDLALDTARSMNLKVRRVDL